MKDKPFSSNYYKALEAIKSANTKQVTNASRNLLLVITNQSDIVKHLYMESIHPKIYLKDGKPVPVEDKTDSSPAPMILAYHILELVIFNELADTIDTLRKKVDADIDNCEYERGKLDMAAEILSEIEHLHQKTLPQDI